jgi:predicted nucleic acid-binding protein
VFCWRPAWRGQAPLGFAARALLDGDDDFLSCETVQLELLPKPTYEKRRSEINFYNEFFAAAGNIEPFSDELGKTAMELAKKYGLASIDALNVSSAIRQGAAEFITSESPGKPLFRVKELRVISLYDLSRD